MKGRPAKRDRAVRWAFWASHSEAGIAIATRSLPKATATFGITLEFSVKVAEIP
jgi:hypothetical protein